MVTASSASGREPKTPAWLTGLEDTPGDTREDLGGLESLDIGRAEEDGDEARDEDEAGHDGVPIAVSLGYEAVDWGVESASREAHSDDGIMLTQQTLSTSVTADTRYNVSRQTHDHLADVGAVG
jgi:hypothetical protein